MREAHFLPCHPPLEDILNLPAKATEYEDIPNKPQILEHLAFLTRIKCYAQLLDSCPASTFKDSNGQLRLLISPSLVPFLPPLSQGPRDNLG